ncbi:Z1 domain-containing protein [Agrobacterium cavarae]|uniref:Z1 domain-containing protein n=1 Tax=Agrobacterium cavarae TaxID=2528239 RepID=UPI0028AD9597|nr:Z1 domain-containing protein [Agrobacterium cavarae]
MPNLLGFFYGRSPKKMQQDTVLQHARMYGNRPKEDLAVSRFYTTAGHYNAFKWVHEFDSALRHAFETGAHDRGVAFVMRDVSNRVTPCAPSKILVSDIVSLRPNGALLPVGFQTRAKTDLSKIMAEVDALVPPDAVDSKQPVGFKCEIAVKMLELIQAAFRFEDGYSFDWEACRAAVEYFSKISSPEEERGD